MTDTVDGGDHNPLDDEIERQRRERVEEHGFLDEPDEATVERLVGDIIAIIETFAVGEGVIEVEEWPDIILSKLREQGDGWLLLVSLCHHNRTRYKAMLSRIRAEAVDRTLAGNVNQRNFRFASVDEEERTRRRASNVHRVNFRQYNQGVRAAQERGGNDIEPGEYYDLDRDLVPRFNKRNAYVKGLGIGTFNKKTKRWDFDTRRKAADLYDNVVFYDRQNRPTKGFDLWMA